MRKILIAAMLIAAALTSPALADDKLNDGAEIGLFAMLCQKHWARLPPRTQRILMSLADDKMQGHDKESRKKAAVEQYLKGYDKDGERWCDRMLWVYDR